jgi:hypothetical protein
VLAIFGCTFAVYTLGGERAVWWPWIANLYTIPSAAGLDKVDASSVRNGE